MNTNVYNDSTTHIITIIINLIDIALFLIATFLLISAIYKIIIKLMNRFIKNRKPKEVHGSIKLRLAFSMLVYLIDGMLGIIKSFII